MNIIERVEMCEMMMRQLHESVEAYSPYADDMCFVAGYDTGKNEQANKTAIKRQIVSIRQSLLALAKEVGA